MKVCIAGTASFEDIVKASNGISCMLESYYYIKEWQIDYIKKHCDLFLLDSGAFTFLSNRNENIDWIEYTKKYAEFINKYNIENFFELDIDSIVGYEKVKEYRKILEGMTNKQCIPVWHINRGKDEFINLCQKYKYVAFGGIAIREYGVKYYKYFPWFIKTAHKYGTKIHALGFTSMDGLHKYHFDSVDSTSWVSGGRFGQLHVFDGSKIKQIQKPNNLRAKHLSINLHNLNEWIKFQEYAKNNL